MFKKCFLIIVVIALSLKATAQRLQLNDFVQLYAEFNHNPIHPEDAISHFLNLKGQGWSKPTVNTNPAYQAIWKYHVQQNLSGVVRLYLQQPHGKPIFTLAYECPYVSLYDSYANDLKSVGGELVDSSNESDGSTQYVYQCQGYTFIFNLYGASIKRFTVDGEPSPSILVTMYPSPTKQ